MTWQISVDHVNLDVNEYGAFTLELTVKQTWTVNARHAPSVRMIPDEAREYLLQWLTTGGPPEPPYTGEA